MARENGFYWVKWQGDWEVCQWAHNIWLLPGIDLHIMATDDDTEEIDENRLINPNK